MGLGALGLGFKALGLGVRGSRALDSVGFRVRACGCGSSGTRI